MPTNDPIDKSFTPRETVGELDKFIVGQDNAKKAVAIALRNRWRRRRVPPELRDEIAPKNIILIGSTGVGKTEIARRLAKLAQAPFVKVEASKFTEVGYVGRDVDSMVRDLVERAVHLVRDEERIRVAAEAKSRAEDRLLDVLLPSNSAPPSYEQQPSAETQQQQQDTSRERLRSMLRSGELDKRQVEIDAPQKHMPTMQVFSNAGLEEMGLNLQDMMGQMMGGPNKTRRRKVLVPEAKILFTEEEASKLIDQEHVTQEAVWRAENNGIIFLDEIDKVAKRGGDNGPDVSREGVQRDILPIVEGSTVTTKYGAVRTDHVLFIAAGAFHISKVSDLIPELQGRFPIRVELDSLGEEELLRILKEPQNSLPVQYTALMQTEGVTLEFSEDGLTEIAKVAASANTSAENIGARRLHTVMEHLLEEISFNAPERSGSQVSVTRGYVQKALKETLESDDLQRYIL